MNGADETRAALLTPIAPGAVAVIALRGPDAPRVVSLVTRSRASTTACDDPEAPSPSQLDRPTLRRLVDGAETLDDVLIVRRRATGHVSDDFELHVHGGVRIAQRVLLLLERQGVRVVDSQQFVTSEGFGHSIDRAVFAALLRAESRRLAEWLLAQREILPAFLATRDQWSASQREAFERRTRAAIRLMGGIRVAIVGPPNAGKSTLANRLIGLDRVITSDVPGTTRDWVEETALIDGWPVTLVDTAGLRMTECKIESEAIQRGAAQARGADLVISVFDACTTDLEINAARQTLAFVTGLKCPFACVLNKLDCADADRTRSLSAQLQRLTAGVVVRLSARSGEGMNSLERAILELLQLDLLKDQLPTGFSEEHLRD